MQRGRRAFTKSSRPRRPMDWENGRMSCFMGPGNTMCRDWIVFPDTLRDNYTDPTLMAMRWFPAFGVAGIGGIPPIPEIIPNAVVGVGIIVWSAKDNSIPAVGDTPLPLSDGELDWVDRWVIPIPQLYSPDEGTYFDVALDNVHLSKAKRRLGSDNGILLVAETKLVTNYWTFSGDVRVLIKE